ncbi:MAG: ABC transporter substrate-binding protein [Betaproteobacteria bacterium]|nr:MAG: ABC transporter substrate-binding protein [Betaproteobacteria bacterium]
MFSKRSIIAAASLACAASLAQAQISDGVVKIGVLSDMSSLYSDIAGSGSTVAARMAVEDFGAARKGMKVEILSADHLNKPDVGSSIARQWYDVDKVDVIVDVPTSSIALAINQITREKGKAFLVSGADYAFGLALERDTEAVVLKNGGKVLGKVRHPLNAQDFSSFLLQAQASKAKIVGLANAGGDTTNSIKQAAEFGIVKGGQSLAGMLVFISDIHGLGLDKAQGLIFTETFYWDLNDQTRAFAKRFAAANSGKYPTMVQAGVYSAITHYLKAVQAGKTDDGTKVIAKMKELPTEDPLFGKGTVRADGRKLHPAYLVEVKKPSESKGPYDYYKIRATIPVDQAFRPMNEGGCSLVK